MINIYMNNLRYLWLQARSVTFLCTMALCCFWTVSIYCKKSNAVFHFGFFAPFFSRLFSAHERKERAADVPPVKFAVVYSFWMVIRMVFTSGWVENAQFISSSGKVLWMLPPITNPQSCRTFRRASSLLSARTSNMPLKIYCVFTLYFFFFFITLKFYL